MIFPRPTKRIGKCLAILGIQTGEPILHRRPGIRIKGKAWKANRLSYNLNVKKITCTPKDKFSLILHTCDNDWCIEPIHLYFGSQADNIHDMYSRHPTVRKKLSEAGTGRKHTLASRKRMSLVKMGNQARLGMHHTEEAKLKSSISNTGQKRSEITKHRLRLAWIKRKARKQQC